MFVILMIGIFFAYLRVAGFKSQSFQAFAHIYVGVVFTLAYCEWSKFYLFVGIGVSLVELGVFLKTKAKLK